MKQYKVIIIGAGGRGINYAQKMQLMPEKYTVVGVADILEERRNDIKKCGIFPKKTALRVGKIF